MLIAVVFAVLFTFSLSEIPGITIILFKSKVINLLTTLNTNYSFIADTHAYTYPQLYLEVSYSGKCTQLSRLISCWQSDVVSMRGTATVQWSNV